jgi:hypothetical protein
MIEPRADRSTWITLAADKGYDTEDFVNEPRSMRVTPHVAQNLSGPLRGPPIIWSDCGNGLRPREPRGSKPRRASTFPSPIDSTKPAKIQIKAE